ncbi:helix-turn-helix domain-containing protein [Sorangium sp. So ce693]|uniref:helix-turn-helix domain-containing protein n=1 Tax=Sorangium sp. So ce693 TaxID=3133318 RepID=UPI003F62A46F
MSEMNGHALIEESEPQLAAAAPGEQAPVAPRDKSNRGARARSVGLPHLLPVVEVAAVLGVSTRTVRRLIKRGELVAYRIKRQLRVDAESVTHMLEVSRIGALKWTAPCRNGNTSLASIISPEGAARTSSGPAGSTVARSPSARPIASRPSASSTNSPPGARQKTLPQNAEELKRELRCLTRRS